MVGPTGQQRRKRWKAWALVCGLFSLFALAKLSWHVASPSNESTLPKFPTAAPRTPAPQVLPTPTLAEPVPPPPPPLVEAAPSPHNVGKKGGASPPRKVPPSSPRLEIDLSDRSTTRQDLIEERARLASEPKSDAGHRANSDCAQGDPMCLDQSGEPDLVDRALEHLRQAALAFNAPRSMALDDVVSVELLLSPAHSPAELEQLIALPGEKHSAPVRASNRMEARLLGGEAFEVTAVTPEEQAISATEPTEWRWSVRPKHGGENTLTLNVTAIFPLEGSSARRSLKMFEQKIEVRVSVGQRLATFVGNNWQWLWTTFLAPLGLWLWTRRRGAEAPTAAGSHAK